MPQIRQGDRQPLNLDVGKVLTVAADSGGSAIVRSYPTTAGAQSDGQFAIASAQSRTFGPYLVPARFVVECDAGSAQYAIGTAAPSSVSEKPVTATDSGDLYSGGRLLGSVSGAGNGKAPGIAAVDWSQVAISGVTAGWAVTLDNSVLYAGLPTLKVSTNGVPSGGTTLIATLALPAPTYFGGAQKLQFAVNPGNRAEAGDSNNIVQLWLGYSGGDTHRLINCAQASNLDGDWSLGGPFRGDAAGSGYLTGTPVWPKVAAEAVTTITLVMTCAAGGMSSPLNISPLLSDAGTVPTLTIFLDGNFSGQYNYARQILAGVGFRASLASIVSWITGAQAGTMAVQQMDRMYEDGHEMIHHTGVDFGGVGWDSAVRFPNGSEYAGIKADIGVSQSYFGSRGWTRGLGYGVIGFTNGFAQTQSLARRQNIARAVRDAGLVKLRQLGGYIGSHYEHAGSSGLVTSTTQLVQTSGATTTAAVAGIVDKLIARGGWTGLTYHDLVLSGESGNNRNVAAFQTDMDYIATQVRAGKLRVLPMSEAFSLTGALPALRRP